MISFFLASLLRLPHCLLKMKRLAIYGILTGLATAGWTYLEYFFGFYETGISRYTGYFTLLILLTGLIMGMRAYRNEEKNGVISFWEAVKAGMVIILLAAMIQGGYNYWYYAHLNPGFIDFMVEKRQQALQQGQATASQVAAQVRQLRAYYQPLSLAFRTFAGFMATGIIFTLITAALLKRYPPE